LAEQLDSSWWSLSLQRLSFLSDRFQFLQRSSLGLSNWKSSWFSFGV